MWELSDFTTARSIALNWLDGVSPLDEDMLRRAAEIAVQAVNSRPGAEVDADALIRELEANLNVLVGAASTLTDEQSDHLPWLPETAGIDRVEAGQAIPAIPAGAEGMGAADAAEFG